MKKCLKCNTICGDEDSFCPACGEKLVSINVCQRCGKPVNPNDVYCRFCGYKIEKEYRCPKCNAVVPEGSKFCPSCGEKIDNPVVSISNCQQSNSHGPVSDEKNNFAKKVLYFTLSGILLTLLVLMLIGCFGDILKSQISPRSIGSESKTPIEYFFGRAISDINKASEGVKYSEYRVFSYCMLALDYICWIAAILSAVTGLVIGGIALYKGYKQKNYNLKSKCYIASFLLGLPYLFVFAVKNSARLDASVYSGSGYTRYLIEQCYGWGTTMILVSIIIGICLLSLYKVALAIIDKNNILRESVFAVLKIASFIVFIFSVNQIVSINYYEAGESITGYTSVYGMFQSSLLSYSSDSIKTVPDYSVMSIIGTLFVLCGALVGISMFILWLDDKVIASYILGVIAVVMMIIGYALAYTAVKDYIAANGAYSSIAQVSAFKYSAMGIAMPIVLTLSMVGCGVVNAIKPNTQAAA